VVKKVINAPEVERVVCATDAGREGELIFRYIYEAAGCKKPGRACGSRRSPPTPSARGSPSLRDGKDFDPLADAARGRSRADWLVGMNLSRAYTLDFERSSPSAACRTPTLAILVEREIRHPRLRPEDYLEVVATFTPKLDGIGGMVEEVPPSFIYRGTWFRGETPTAEAKRLKADPKKPGADLEESHGDRRPGEDRPRRGGVGARRDEADAAAAPLRPHRAATPRQPPLRLQRPEERSAWRRRSTSRRS